MAAVAVKVVVATGMFEVEELQKNCREFEGGTGFFAEAGFVVLFLTELASVLNTGHTSVWPGRAAPIKSSRTYFPFHCSCDFFSFSIVVV